VVSGLRVIGGKAIGIGAGRLGARAVSVFDTRPSSPRDLHKTPFNPAPRETAASRASRGPGEAL